MTKQEIIDYMYKNNVQGDFKIEEMAEDFAQPDLQPTCNNLATDLISRQAAIDYIKTQRGRPFIGITLEEAIIMMIEEVPSAEPEVIRCRDCKHHDGIRCFRWNSTIITGFDDFCSNAEKRGEENE